LAVLDFRKRVKKSEDNLAIIESANEQVKLISDKYLPKIKKWLQDTAKISSNILIYISMTIRCEEGLGHLHINYKIYSAHTST